MMDLKRKLAVGAVGVVGFAGLGAGVAAAQTTPSAPKAPVTAPAPADTDNVQSGDQTTPDVPGAAEKPEATAAAEKAGTETAGPEEPGDASLPGGGHADPAGQNVDHQFEGVE
ncbi:MAG: hypothetical protein QOC79_2505 [Actinomycetota bacterium]|jgi:hypothetical protein|nr:hypothetical protein [Actinomycetota bacterium]